MNIERSRSNDREEESYGNSRGSGRGGFEPRRDNNRNYGGRGDSDHQQDNGGRGGDRGGDRGGFKGREDRPKGCFTCGDLSHMSRECTQRGGDRPKGCFNCGDLSHISRNCTQEKKFNNRGPREDNKRNGNGNDREEAPKGKRDIQPSSTGPQPEEY